MKHDGHARAKKPTFSPTHTSWAQLPAVCSVSQSARVPWGARHCAVEAAYAALDAAVLLRLRDALPVNAVRACRCGVW